jgi:transcription elongation factor Elf1
MDIPDLNKAGEKAKEAAKDGKQWVQSKVSILPDRFVCPKCEEICVADYTYDPDTASFHAETNGQVPSWYCSNCETHYHREETGVTGDLYDR